MTRSDRRAGHKQADEWCERFAGALKMDEQNMLKKKKKHKTQKPAIDICIK